MRVAIAGSGDLTRYFCEEFTRVGHEVTVLARSEKSYLRLDGVVQTITDYSSVASIKEAIGESEVLVSTILDYTPAFTDVHKALIEACKLSPKCKRFVPSEYGGNLEDYPDQPKFYFPNHEPIRAILRHQHDLEWTLVSVGWLVDYIVPSKNRYLKDLGAAFPINITDKEIIIPGAGIEPVDVISARDLAKAMAALVSSPSWEPYTYISGEHTTWRAIKAQVQKRYGGFTEKQISLAQLVDSVIEAPDSLAKITAEYQIFSASGAGAFSAAKVQAHREKYFKEIHFRSVCEILEEVARDSSVII